MFAFLARFVPPRADTPRDRALAALRKGDFERAEREFTQLLPVASLAGERAFLLNKRGVARIGLRQRDAAETDFSAALESVANYPPALTNLGNVRLESGDVQAAIAHYESAIGADPNYALAHQNVAVAYKRAGRIEDAVKSLRRARQLGSLEKTTFGRLRRRS